jgi:Fur family transcriptional regulator, zinc uptake regulator
MTKKLASKTSARPAHDHQHCVSAALATAEQTCAESGRRLTPLRKRVLEMVWNSHAPVKAYDLLRDLGKEHAGAAPATIYRALEFLLEAGLVHRIASQNTFIGCSGPGAAHSGQFLLCSRCGNVLELVNAKLASMINAQAGAVGFRVVHQTIEVSGLCSSCQ